MQDIVAIFSTDDLSAYQLYDESWTVISHLKEVSLRVLSLTFDGASITENSLLCMMGH